MLLSRKKLSIFLIFLAGFIGFCFTIFLVADSKVNAQTTKSLSPQEIQDIVKGAKHTLKDFGLSEESVKWLSPQEIQDILNSKTLAERKEEIEKSGTPEQKAALNNPQPTNPGLPAGVVNCFDYYHFGSVQTQLTGQSFNYNPGDIINFKGPITNQNDYPIIDGALYIKIFRIRNAQDGNGHDVVDQFIAADNITIPAKGKVPVAFSWKVPLSLSEGNYKIAKAMLKIMLHIKNGKQ